MAVSHLKCKECKAQYPLEALYVCEQCFGPLEVAYDHAARARRGRAAPPHPGRPAEHLALRRLPAARGRPPRAVGAARLARRPAGRVHAADPRRPPRRAARPARGVGQERRREPDPLVQGPRRLGRRQRARASSASRPSPAPRRATWPTRWRPTAPRWGWSPTCSSPPTSRSRRCSRRASTATKLVGRGRQLRRRQPPLHRAVRRARLGVREHQPAPLLRRGLEDAGVRDRRAARLGAPRPLRRAGGVGLAVHENRQGLRGVARARAARWRAARDERRPGRGLLARGQRVRRGPGRLPPGQARHDRQVAGDRQPRRRSVCARSRPPHRRRRRRRHRRGDPRRASHCSPKRPGSSPRPPGASRRRCSRSSPRAATSTPTSASCW